MVAQNSSSSPLVAAACYVMRLKCAQIPSTVNKQYDHARKMIRGGEIKPPESCRRLRSDCSSQSAANCSCSVDCDCAAHLLYIPIRHEIHVCGSSSLGGVRLMGQTRKAEKTSNLQPLICDHVTCRDQLKYNPHGERRLRPWANRILDFNSFVATREAELQWRRMTCRCRCWRTQT